MSLSKSYIQSSCSPGVVPIGVSNNIFQIPASRVTTWQPGVTYNIFPATGQMGIPTNRTQSGSTISPIGQLGSFTGSTSANSNTLTVSGSVTGTALASGQVIFDAGMTTCFGVISGGSGTSWTFQNNCSLASSSVSMISVGSDSDAINTALAAAPAGTYVLLSAGRFVCSGNGISHRKNNVTLRGTGQWVGTEINTGDPPPASPSITILWKADSGVFAGAQAPQPCLTVGSGSGSFAWSTVFDLASDGIKGSNTITLTSAYSGSVGDLVLIDKVGDSDPDVFYGNRQDLSGYFNGTISGSNLTINSVQNGPVGVNMDLTFHGSLSGTTLTINSANQLSLMQALNGSGTNPFPTAVFDTLNNFYGYITSGNYPGPFTLSQSNSTQSNISMLIGGIAPVINGDPIFDSKFGTLQGFLSGGTFPNMTLDRSPGNQSNVTLTIGGGSKRGFGGVGGCNRQNRFIGQMMRVQSFTSIAPFTVTFETPLHTNFQTAYSAQLAIPGNGYNIGIGIENLTIYAGNGGDGNGNLPMFACMYSWVKNVQSLYSEGTGIGMYMCYRCELRDSYSHSAATPNPGGGGYLTGMNAATADCLFENNIMWAGDKVVVARAVGGGNVIAYNYMDDAFGAGFPQSPEDGVNSGHFGGSMFTLMEGNYSHQGAADAFWGNMIYCTYYRNWLSGLRAAANLQHNFDLYFLTTNAATTAGSNVLHFDGSSNNPTTNIYNGLVVKDFNAYGAIPAGTTVTGVTATTVTLSNNVTGIGVANGDGIHFYFEGTLNNFANQFSSNFTEPYIDSWGRQTASLQAHCYNLNFVGNVLGYKTQAFLGFTSGGSTYQQTTFVYEDTTGSAPTGSQVAVYVLGAQQDPETTFFPAVNYMIGSQGTLLRNGNGHWDFSGNYTQVWYANIGDSGLPGTGSPQGLANSLYLTSAPAFWDSSSWPPYNPSTGVTSMIPAHTKFKTLTGGLVTPPGNQ